MALPSWWQVAIPRKDIITGELTEAIFAADLGDVVSGCAPIEYQDASIFFQKTYLTCGLSNLLDNVLNRLTSGKGDSVIQLQTPFGGGKTHSLLALYHIVQNYEKIKYVDFISKFTKVKDAKIVVFVGTQPNPLKDKTLWGEIAYQLGCYDKVKENDEKRRAPGRKILDEILGDSPVLILIDELVEYMVKAKDFAEQISAFSQELTETIKSKDNCCLICTLPSSAPYGEVGERALQELQKIYGRIETVYTPVEGVEIYEIIRKRLFENIGDEKTVKKVAQNYFNLYQQLGADTPSDVRELEYRKRIEHAYPFHPELIDVLYERWGSYHTFQRTRGILRILAEVVRDLYTRKVVSPLIQSSLINFDNQTIRREFIKHIGNEYDSVISADISVNAGKIDKEMGSEYEKYNIARGIATSVFLYSFSAGISRDTTLPRIRVSLLRENIPPTIVGDAVAKLEERLWYFHSEKTQYAFRNQPNITKIIMEKEETVSNEVIQNKIREFIQKHSGKSLEVYIWPESSSDIPDNKNLKLIILSSIFSYNYDKGRKFAEELFEKAGIGFRIYKNVFFILMIDENQFVSLNKTIRRYLALNEIQNDKSLMETLVKQSQEEIKKKFKDTEKEIPFKILTAYRYLGLLGEKGIDWKDLGIPTVGSEDNISERVKQYLRDQEKLLSRLTPKYLIDKTFGKDEEEKSVKEIYELHLKTPGMPILENMDILLNAIGEGVKTGILGVRETNEIYYKQTITPNIDSIIMRGEIAKVKKEEEIIPAESTEKPLDVKQLELISQSISLSGKVKNLYLKATIPWDKLSDLVKGVIKPLKEKGTTSDITIEIKANSEDGFDRITLDSKVKETLKQIGGKIEEWKEE